MALASGKKNFPDYQTVDLKHVPDRQKGRSGTTLLSGPCVGKGDAADRRML